MSAATGGVQLAIALAVVAPGPVPIVIAAGIPLSVGLSLSLTVTVCVAVERLPDSSAAVQVTMVCPLGNVARASLVTTMRAGRVQLSFTVGRPRFTAVEQFPGPSSLVPAFTLAGAVICGRTSSLNVTTAVDSAV